MTARLFAYNAIAVGGGPASGAKLNVYTRSTTTRTPWYTDVGLTTPATNPVIADSDGRIAVYFQDTAEFTIACTTADGATNILEADIVGGVLLVDTSSTLIVDPTWLPIISAPFNGVREVATYSALSALASASVSDGDIYYVQGGDAAGDGAHGYFRFVAGSSTTAVAGVIIAHANGRFFRNIGDGPFNLIWATRGQPYYSTSVAYLVDYRTHIQEALDYCLANGHSLYVPAGKRIFAASQTPGQTYCIYNGGVSIVCERAPVAFQSAFTFANGIGAIDFMECSIASGGAVDSWVFDSIFIDTAFGGSPRGRRGIFFNFDEACTCLKMQIINPRIGNAGGGHSIEFYSDDALNPQGVPFAMEFNGGALFEGLKAYGISDSCVFRDVLCRSSIGSNRIGMDIQTVTANGARPQMILIVNPNIDADGGSIRVTSGGKVTIRDYDLEQSHGTCTAIIDITGSDEVMAGVEIENGSIGVFGTAAATSCIRLANCLFPKVDSYKIISVPTGGGYTAPTNGILIENTTTDAFIGTGQISDESGRITEAVTDNGVGTRGVTKPITPDSPFTNVSAGFAPLQYTKALDGTVTITGWIEGTTANTPETICTMPVGARPLEAYRKYDRGNLGGTIGDAVFQILTSGVFTVSASTGSGRQFPINLSYPTLPYVIGHD